MLIKYQNEKTSEEESLKIIKIKVFKRLRYHIPSSGFFSRENKK